MSCQHLGCSRPAHAGTFCAEHMLSAAAMALKQALRRPLAQVEEITVSGRLQRSRKLRSPVA